MPWIKDVFVLARDLVFYDTSSSSSVFPHDLVSDIQSNAGYEVCCLYQALFGTPKLLYQRCSIWPLLCPFSLMKRAGLQNMLWGMWACLTWAVRGVRQSKSVKVGSQAAVSGA